jgi:LEA14-like dessication related protein
MKGFRVSGFMYVGFQGLQNQVKVRNPEPYPVTLRGIMRVKLLNERV